MRLAGTLRGADHRRAGPPGSAAHAGGPRGHSHGSDGLCSTPSGTFPARCACCSGSPCSAAASDSSGNCAPRGSERGSGISLVFALLLLVISVRQTLLDLFPRPGHCIHRRARSSACTWRSGPSSLPWPCCWASRSGSRSSAPRVPAAGRPSGSTDAPMSHKGSGSMSSCICAHQFRFRRAPMRARRMPHFRLPTPPIDTRRQPDCNSVGRAPEPIERGRVAVEQVAIAVADAAARCWSGYRQVCPRSRRRHIARAASRLPPRPGGPRANCGSRRPTGRSARIEPGVILAPSRRLGRFGRGSPLAQVGWT